MRKSYVGSALEEGTKNERAFPCVGGESEVQQSGAIESKK